MKISQTLNLSIALDESEQFKTHTRTGDIQAKSVSVTIRPADTLGERQIKVLVSGRAIRKDGALAHISRQDYFVMEDLPESVQSVIREAMERFNV